MVLVVVTGVVMVGIAVIPFDVVVVVVIPVTVLLAVVEVIVKVVVVIAVVSVVEAVSLAVAVPAVPLLVVGNIRVVVVNAVRDVLADIEGIVEVVFPLVVAGKKNIVGSHLNDLSNTKRMTTKTHIPYT